MTRRGDARADAIMKISMRYLKFLRYVIFLRPSVMSGTGPVQFPGTIDAGTTALLRDCAMLCDIAYRQPSAVNTMWADHHKAGQPLTGCWEVLKRVPTLPQYVECKECDAQCYLIEYKPISNPDGLDKESVLAICCRGSSSLMDFMCDADIRQTQFRDAADKPLPDVQVHAGFYRQYIALFRLFDTEVKRHLEAGGHVLCTGHSLGSAAITLAAMNYASQYKGQVYYVGLGTPRVGNSAFAKAFDGCVKLKARLKNAADPVNSILPPVCGYTHVGYELHLGPADPFPQLPVILDIADHSVTEYQKNLQKPEVAKATIPGVSRSWYLSVVDAFRWTVDTTKK